MTEPPLVADLTLGSWQPHGAARQIAAQLAVPFVLPELAAYGEDPFAAPGAAGHGGRISGGIDVEAAGDAGVLAAAGFAETALAVLGDRAAETTLVLLPGDSAEPEDLAYLDFLAEGLRAAGGRVVSGSVWDEPAAPSAARILGLVPGLLDPVLVLALQVDAAGLDGLVALRGGQLLIPPGWRAGGAQRDYDELAARSAGVPWLHAYARFHGSPDPADAGRLARIAWSALRAGAGGLAVRLAERAAERAPTPLRRAAVEAGLQAMRIALCRYAEAAAVPDPDPALPAQLYGFLGQAKGWGLAMTAEAADALKYLTRAAELRPDARKRERLYLSNITALALLRGGQPAEALAAERDIERRAALLRPRDFGLEYVNRINQARLYRRQGDHVRAREYYERAFATVEGVRTDSDAVHANVCLARVAEAAGEQKRAWRLWLRAALHWLAMPVPEALAWRVATAILGSRPGIGDDLVEPVARALLDRLPPARLASPARFLRRPESPEWLAAADGWCVYGLAKAGRVRPVQDRPAVRELRQTVHALLLAACPDERLARAEFLAVPDNQGRELPETKAGAIGMGVLDGVRTWLLAGQVVELSDAEYSRLRARIRVSMGPAVAAVEPRPSGVRVHFRRYRPPLDLTPAQAAALPREGNAPLCPESAALLAARVLVADLEDACTQGGIKQPSNMSCTPG
ncbi:hypothetical protein ACFXPA_11845 [Amycolatopsis sp. NPDC059090]|uniref:hypothetical protein n=1 Tax=unclassified Amycolatopsis TaxID=2618356 RepID=UPI00366B84C0